MSGLDPVRQIAREWIRFAQGELNAARTLAENRDDNLPALSALPSDRFPAIHQIGSLASLNPYAVATRYPMMHAANPLSLNAGPEWDDADAAIALAERVLAAAVSDLA